MGWPRKARLPLDENSEEGLGTFGEVQGEILGRS
jgi:hypothetical protein